MKTLWLVTFVTHNSRVSNRMIQFGIRRGSPLLLTPAQIRLIAGALIEAWTRYRIPVCACNVLPDHVHMIVAASSEQELNESVRKLKGFSSHEFGKAIPSGPGVVWQQKFNRKAIPDETALRRAFEYVWNNHRKHLPHDDNPCKGTRLNNGQKPPCLSGESGNGLQPIEEIVGQNKGARPNKGQKPPCLGSESGNGLQPIVGNDEDSDVKLHTVEKHEAIIEKLRAACVPMDSIFSDI